MFCSRSRPLLWRGALHDYSLEISRHDSNPIPGPFDQVMNKCSFVEPPNTFHTPENTQSPSRIKVICFPIAYANICTSRRSIPVGRLSKASPTQLHDFTQPTRVIIIRPQTSSFNPGIRSQYCDCPRRKMATSSHPHRAYR